MTVVPRASRWIAAVLLAGTYLCTARAVQSQELLENSPRPGQILLTPEPAETTSEVLGSAPPAPASEPAAAPKPELPFWAKYPIVTAFPRPGWFLVPPTGPGYYSLMDAIRGNYLEKPPAYPYPRFGLMQFSFFDADWRYLDRPDNQETDYLDCLKRIHLGDDFLFTTGGEVRFRYSNEIDSRLLGVNNNYYLNRVRAYGDLWYRDNLRVFAEFLYADSTQENLLPLLIDETGADILNLFVDAKLGECGEAPVYLRLGRQELLYGSQRLVSPLEWANTRRTFQGVKLFARGEKWDVDLFCVQPVIPHPQRFDSVDNDQVFTGLWTTYRPKKGQNIDVYYLNLDQTRRDPVRLALASGPFNVHTIGARYVGDSHNVLWDVEGAVQFGERADQSILANAFTAGVGYNFKDCPMSPQFWVYYDYASGDPNPGTGNTYRTFNQLFPFGHYYFGYIDVVGRQNIHDINGQFAIYPTKWLVLGAQLHIFRLDSPTDALYNAAGIPIRRDRTGQAGSSVGEEIDIFANLHIDKHQDVYLSYSHLYAGDFIRKTGNALSPSYLFIQYSYRW